MLDEAEDVVAQPHGAVRGGVGGRCGGGGGNEGATGGGGGNMLAEKLVGAGACGVKKGISVGGAVLREVSSNAFSTSSRRAPQGGLPWLHHPFSSRTSRP